MRLTLALTVGILLATAVACAQPQKSGMRDSDGNFVPAAEIKQPLQHYEIGSVVTSVLLLNDRNEVITASDDGVIRFWDQKGKVVREIERQSRGWGASLALSPKRDKLVSAGLDGSSALWEVTTGKEAWRISRGLGEGAQVAWSPDGRQLATRCASGTILLSDPASGKSSGALGVPRRHVQRSFCFAPDGEKLLGVCADGAALIWKLSTGEILERVPVDEQILYSAAWSNDGRFIAAGGRSRMLCVVDTGQNNAIAKYMGHQGGISVIRFADSNYLLSADVKGTVILWSFRSGKMVKWMHPCDSEIVSMDVARTPTRILILLGTLKNGAILYEITMESS